MAKRDLIDKQELIASFKGSEDAEYAKWTTDGIIMQIEDADVIEIDDVESITEQEIVRPYLERLKEQIQGFTWRGNYAFWNGIDAVVSAIDNMLAEQDDVKDRGTENDY